MTVQDLVKTAGVSKRTVYRWINSGKIKAEKVDNKWEIDEDIDIDSLCDSVNDNDNQIEHLLREQIKQLKEENKYLREKLDQIQTQAAEAEERHDTIVMSLSNQLSEERKKLEDMRNRSLWTRVKTALGFVSSYGNYNTPKSGDTA